MTSWRWTNFDNRATRLTSKNMANMMKSSHNSSPLDFRKKYMSGHQNLKNFALFLFWNFQLTSIWTMFLMMTLKKQKLFLPYFYRIIKFSFFSIFKYIMRHNTALFWSKKVRSYDLFASYFLFKGDVFSTKPKGDVFSTKQIPRNGDCQLCNIIDLAYLFFRYK